MSALEKCPECGGSAVMKIVYGMPDGDFFDNHPADVLLGGCVITPTSMTKQCGDCGSAWAPLSR